MKVITKVGKTRIVAKSHSELLRKIKGEVVRQHLYIKESKQRPKQLTFKF